MLVISPFKTRLKRTRSCTLITALAHTEADSLLTGMNIVTKTPENAVSKSLLVGADPLRMALLCCPCTPRKPQRPSKFRLNVACIPTRLMRRLVF
ncbi:unnamed protein product [Closterium sp. NIES-65]|nr:unnamed protein product [Closterium sp. NIES-65]